MPAQQRDLELGSAFDVSLVKARDLRDDARTLMRQGSLNGIVWTAVQLQINAEKERTTADRQEAERPRRLRGE